MLSFFFLRFKNKSKRKRNIISRQYGQREDRRVGFEVLANYYEAKKVQPWIPNNDFEINVVNLAKVFSRHGKRQKMVLTVFKILYLIQGMYRKSDVTAHLKRKITQLTLIHSLYRPPVRKHLRKSPTRTIFKKMAVKLRKRFYLGTRFLLQSVVSLRKKLRCALGLALFLELFRVLYRTRSSATFRGLAKFVRQTGRIKTYDHMFYIRTRRRKEKERKNRLGKKRSRWLKR